MKQPLALFHKFFRVSTLLFFLGGTGILIAYLVDKTNDYRIWGYMYTKLSFAINYLLLAIVLIRRFTKPDKADSNKTIGLMLLNIPVVFLYMYIVLGPEFIGCIPLLMFPLVPFW